MCVCVYMPVFLYVCVCDVLEGLVGPESKTDFLWLDVRVFLCVCVCMYFLCACVYEFA